MTCVCLEKYSVVLFELKCQFPFAFLSDSWWWRLYEVLKCLCLVDEPTKKCKGRIIHWSWTTTHRGSILYLIWVMRLLIGLHWSVYFLLGIKTESGAITDSGDTCCLWTVLKLQHSCRSGHSQNESKFSMAQGTCMQESCSFSEWSSTSYSWPNLYSGCTLEKTVNIKRFSSDYLNWFVAINLKRKCGSLPWYMSTGAHQTQSPEGLHYFMLSEPHSNSIIQSVAPINGSHSWCLSILRRSSVVSKFRVCVSGKCYLLSLHPAQISTQIYCLCCYLYVILACSECKSNWRLFDLWTTMFRQGRPRNPPIAIAD